MKVLIYEDQDQFYEFLSTTITKYSIEKNIDFNVKRLSDFDDFINNNYDDSCIINIIDIVNEKEPDKDGIKLSKRIRAVNENSFIIFFTSHLKYLNEVVNSYIEPISYLNKCDKNIEQSIFSLLDEIIYRCTCKKKILFPFTNYYNDTIFINLSSIHFIKPSNKQKYVNIYTYDNIFEVKGRLNDFFSISEFLKQSSKSTVVNVNKIVSITKGTNYKNKILNTKIKDPSLNNLCILTNSFKSNFL